MKKDKTKIILATKNRFKSKEMKLAFGEEFECVDLNAPEFSHILDVEETGDTYFANACLKAHAVSLLYPSTIVVGEDSGLEVSILNDAPGIYSARYAGEPCNHENNNVKLLGEIGLENLPAKAFMISAVIVFINGKGTIKAIGKLPGFIAINNTYNKTSNVFGYDNIFFVETKEKRINNYKPLCDLTLDEKNKISHRGQAIEQIKKYIIEYSQINKIKNENNSFEEIFNLILNNPDDITIRNGLGCFIISKIVNIDLTIKKYELTIYNFETLGKDSGQYYNELSIYQDGESTKKFDFPLFSETYLKEIVRPFVKSYFDKKKKEILTDFRDVFTKN